MRQLPVDPYEDVPPAAEPYADDECSEAGHPAALERALRGAEADLLSGLRTGDWLDRQDFPALMWTVPGVIPEGLTILAGPPKAGKSWFILSTSLAVAAGEKAIGRINVAQKPVLYIALEDGDRRLQERCRKLLPGKQIPAEFTYITQVTSPLLMDTIGAWCDRYGQEALVVIDTLGKVAPDSRAGESAYGRDYRIGTALKRIADDRPGLSLVVIHHVRKATSDDFVDSVSGTNGLAGAADTIVILNRPRQSNDGVLKVTGRDVDEAEYAMSFVEADWILDGDDLSQAATKAEQKRATEGVGDTMGKIVAYVSSQEHATPQEVAEALGLSEPVVRNYLIRAVKAKRIDRASRGVYVSVTSVTSDTSDESPELEAGSA